MNHLIIENLKIYKYQYLLSIVSVSVGIVLTNYIDVSSFFFLIMLLGLMLFPELQRLNMLTNDGYLKLVNKLPLTFKEIYLHKFVVSISGILIVMFMLSISTIFFGVPNKLFKFMNILVSNIYAGIIIHNSTKLFVNPKKYFKFQWTFANFLFYTITLFIFFSLFDIITERNYVQLPNWHRSINYLIFFSVQCILAFYIGKLREFVSKFQFLKNYDYENEPKV